MKKALALVLALVFAFAFVACGDTSTPTNDEKSVAVMYYDFADIYISTVRSALDEQLNAAGIKFSNFDSANNQATQIDQVSNALANGDDLLVINLVDTESDAAQTIIDLAAAQNVPVIFFNRSVSDDLLKDNVLFVGTDAPEAGHLQGDIIGNYVSENFDAIDLNGDGVITYAMLKGQEGNAEADARTKFSVEDANKVLAAAGKAELKYYLDGATAGVDGQFYELDEAGDWCAAHGNDIITRAIQNSKDMIEIVIANNDGMAEGAIAALQAAGYNTPDSEIVIPVFGVDATDRAKELIGQGAMTGTVKQDNVGMATALTLAIQNGLAGNALNDGLVGTHGDITFSSAPGVDNKIYVPYAPYLG